MTDYTELLELLRYCSSKSGCIGCKLSEAYDCTDDLTRDAAAAIEELQAQLPKRGEWIVREVDSPGEMHPVAFRCMCSMCLNEYVFPRIPKYCPDCGSMNTAKMEVQE